MLKAKVVWVGDTDGTIGFRRQADMAVRQPSVSPWLFLPEASSRLAFLQGGG